MHFFSIQLKIQNQVYLGLFYYQFSDYALIKYKNKNCMSYYSNSSNHHGMIRQNQRTEQKVIQDQNFSNEIFFGILSTIQSIMLYHGGKTNQYSNKMFKHYDRVDYRSKNIGELKSQLQTQILLFKASLTVFHQENRHTKWSLPNQFSFQQAQSFLFNALQVFKNFNDSQSQKLTIDVGRLLNGHLDNLYAENVNLKVTYSQAEKKGHKKNLIPNGIVAGQQMDKRKEQVKNCQETSDLPVNINKNSHLFSHGSHGKKIQNGNQGGNHEIKMQIEHDETKSENKNQWSYLVLYYKQHAQSILGKRLSYKLLYSNNWKLFQDQNMFQSKRKELENEFKYLLRVKLDKHKDIQRFYGEIQTLKKK